MSHIQRGTLYIVPLKVYESHVHAKTLPFGFNPSMEPRFGASSAGHKQTDSYAFRGTAKKIINTLKLNFLAHVDDLIGVLLST
jgi:hypothetical protein